MRAALALRPGLARWTAFDAAGRETCETGDPAVWGDAILLRKEFPASYHLAVVVDDAASGVTHVVRGEDLHAATALHRLLQDLLGYSAPAYCHHPLIVDAEGRKLSKSDGATALRDLAAGGLSPAEARRMALGGLAAHRIESDSPEDRR
jgi:glutamyl-Q tRNA(Asp) synthetase